MIETEGFLQFTLMGNQTNVRHVITVENSAQFVLGLKM